jgi:uronate dehydrogenase
MTGAAGIVGKAIRPYLSKAFEEVVLMTHRTPCENLAANERVVKGDIQDREFVDSVLKDVDGLIHLAGLVGPDYTFEQVLGPNLVGTNVLFESCLANGIEQIIYASSHHAIGFFPRGAAIDEETPIRADSWYGVSKAFGEILAKYYADKHGLNIVSVRIGSVTEKAVDERRKHAWSSPRDLARLFELGLKRQEKGHRLVYGVSECPEPFFNNDSAKEMGYEPMDNSEDNLDDESLRDAQPDLQNPENLFIGGYFASGGLSQEMVERFLAGRNEPALCS